ncbi:hypothetical protein M8C22_06355 [Bacillus spizizenii]|uniref:hypothetical protein n=1 Tax=Bacillus spizizenii TaxID=96241 RepID=UPI0009A2DC3A|nr:hypothetical protein [Bacillus spizizenii]OPG90625.1 hypothetical protein B2I22_15320 [Bacillus spizizenii]
MKTYNPKEELKHEINRWKTEVNSEFMDAARLNCEVDAALSAYVQASGKSPLQSEPKLMNLISDLLVKVHENIERLQIKERTREEWEREEEKYIPPMPSEVPAEYRVCACWNCNNVFQRLGKKKYCSDACGQEQRDADKRLKRTGTYLAPKRDGYLLNREENAGKKDEGRLVFTDRIHLYGKRELEGNRPYSPRRNTEAKQHGEIKFGQVGGSGEEKSEYERFRDGESPGIFTVDIASGLKIYHTSGKKHEYSERDTGAWYLFQSCISHSG